MNETHASFTQKEVKDLVHEVGLQVSKFIKFQNIEESLKYHKIKLKHPVLPWERKFLLISYKN